ncbi:MAG: beta family protein [Alphaproteobacteria bacterium]|nr:beta family protein [Alphaproteobacteria bacterium]
MSRYCYFPILKTRPSEVNAYDLLDDTVKDEILPIIEMTGELGYTYSKNCKDESRRGTKRPGDINKKITKILTLMGNRRFILDITDDKSLKYDGLGSTGSGLLNPENGYKNWVDFLKRDDDFKRLVIPTIQFDTTYREDVQKQIIELNAQFDYLAVKLPKTEPEIINQIIAFIVDIVGQDKLFVILDFDYVKKFDEANILQYVDGINVSKIKGLIPVSSSFPASVIEIDRIQGSIDITENRIVDSIKQKLGSKVFHGDFASIYPSRYEMGGGGWYPRIDFIERDLRTKKPVKYHFLRGTGRNTSSEYVGLAKKVLLSRQYVRISELNADGDKKIEAKALGGTEGKAPSYWIAVRSNLYLTMQYLYLKRQQGAFLYL